MESLANQNPTFGHLSNLSVEKLQELDKILTSILALPIARNTYAQIIDGIPTRTPHSDDIKAHRSHLIETIIVSDNAKPSDKAIREYEKTRTDFELHVLRIDLMVCLAFGREATSADLTRHSWLKDTKMRCQVAVNTNYASWRW